MGGMVAERVEAAWAVVAGALARMEWVAEAVTGPEGPARAVEVGTVPDSGAALMALAPGVVAKAAKTGAARGAQVAKAALVVAGCTAPNHPR